MREALLLLCLVGCAEGLPDVRGAYDGTMTAKTHDGATVFDPQRIVVDYADEATSFVAIQVRLGTYCRLHGTLKDVYDERADDCLDLIIRWEIENVQCAMLYPNGEEVLWYMPGGLMIYRQAEVETWTLDFSTTTYDTALARRVAWVDFHGHRQ